MLRALHAAQRQGASKQHLAFIARQYQFEMGKDVARVVSNSAHEAHRDSVQGYGRHVAQVDQRDNVLTTNSTEVELAVRRRFGAIRTRIEASTANLSAAITQKIEFEINQPKLPGASIEGEHIEQPHIEQPHEDVAKKAEVAAADAEWMVDRMAVTEMASAYNVGQLSGGFALSGRVPNLFNRWVEHVSDSTWEPTDKKTALDSIYLHAQVALPGGMFTMPDDIPTGDFQGDEWEGPPNRPHDRAILTPWRPQWGLPGWMTVGGRRSWIVRGKGPSGRKRKR